MDAFIVRESGDRIPVRVVVGQTAMGSVAFAPVSPGEPVPSGTVGFREIPKIEGLPAGFSPDVFDRLEIGGKSFPVVDFSVEHSHWDEVLAILRAV